MYKSLIKREGVKFIESRHSEVNAGAKPSALHQYAPGSSSPCEMDKEIQALSKGNDLTWRPKKTGDKVGNETKSQLSVFIGPLVQYIITRDDQSFAYDDVYA